MNLNTSIFFLFIFLSIYSCKKDKNKPKDPNSELPTLVTGAGWTVENKYKTDIPSLFLVGIENERLVKYNNNFYWKLNLRTNDPIFGGNTNYIHFKLQNTSISEFVPQAPNYNSKTDEFYFFENDPSERSAVLNNGFKLFNGKNPTFSGWDLLFWPNTTTMDLHLAPHLKHSVCYNIANYSTVTTLNLETGKFDRYRNYGGIGFNNGSFAVDEKYNNTYPNSFKTYHTSINYTGNYKMHLIIGEICDTIKNKYGDPSSNSNANEGYFILTKPIDTLYLCNLGGIGYNFGDGFTKSVDAGDKVYIYATCKGMTDKYKLYTFDKITRKLSFLYTHNGINTVSQLFYRKGKNDLILNTDKGLFKLDLNNLSFSDINPTVNANTAVTKFYTQPYSNGIACTLNGITTNANLIYFE